MRFILESTKAIGDAIIATAVLGEAASQGYVAGIITSPLTYPLLKNLDIKTYRNWSEVPGGGTRIPLDHRYLNHLPHRFNLPNQQKKGWLGEWMAIDIQDASEGEIILTPKREDMRISLTCAEIAESYDEKKRISGENGNKQVTQIIANSSSINKNITRETLEKVIKELSGETVFCMTEALGVSEEDKQFYQDLNVVLLKMTDLRRAVGRLHVADAVVTSDTWTLHGAIASRRTGTQLSLSQMGYIPTNKQVIAVLGSSHPLVVGGYEGMTTVTTQHPCNSCGAHAYNLLELLEDKTGVKYHKLGEDGSGCVWQYAADTQIPPCMKYIKPEDIIDAIRFAFKHGKGEPKPLGLIAKK